MSEADRESEKMLEPNLEPFYGNLKNYVRMVTQGYSNLLLLDARGGLGKTHNVLETLSDECVGSELSFVHQKGFTTPIELYKSLYEAREDDTILFLDDMSGVTGNQKAIDMLKAATDTQGEENWVEYRTSRDIENPTNPDLTLGNQFCFRGRIIMSFNDTPDNRHFAALRDRGTDYKLSFTHPERIELIKEMAKLEDFSKLSQSEQIEIAYWIETVTDSSFEVTLRTFSEVCEMKRFSDDTGADWKKMALELFDLDHEKYLIIDLRENSDMSIADQIETFKEKTGRSKSHYYNKLEEIKQERK